MKIRQNPADQRQTLQAFLDSSRKMPLSPRQTSVKACDWDISEVLPNKPQPPWEIFAAEDDDGKLIGVLALDPVRWQIDLLAVAQRHEGEEACRTVPSSARRYSQKTSSF